ncbi:MAG: hypothetical protein ACJ8R9_22170 [Steroidobacteraceae bacterium]
MEITDQHRRHRWKFLAGGGILGLISGLDGHFGGVDLQSSMGLVSILQTGAGGALLGALFWWAWAKTKKMDSSE